MTAAIAAAQRQKTALFAENGSDLTIDAKTVIDPFDLYQNSKTGTSRAKPDDFIQHTNDFSSDQRDKKKEEEKEKEVVAEFATVVAASNERMADARRQTIIQREATSPVHKQDEGTAVFPSHINPKGALTSEFKITSGTPIGVAGDLTRHLAGQALDNMGDTGKMLHKQVREFDGAIDDFKRGDFAAGQHRTANFVELTAGKDARLAGREVINATTALSRGDVTLAQHHTANFVEKTVGHDARMVGRDVINGTTHAIKATEKAVDDTGKTITNAFNGAVAATEKAKSDFGQAATNTMNNVTTSFTNFFKPAMPAPAPHH